MTDRDWELLRKAAEQEKNESTLKEMREVLDEHQAALQSNTPKAEQDGGGQPATRSESK
jgi:hypothetical protein